MRSVMTSAASGLLAVSVASFAGKVAADPFDLYGDSIKFEVLRNGKPVGFHTTRFVRDGNGLEVLFAFHPASGSNGPANRVAYRLGVSVEFFC